MTEKILLQADYILRFGDEAEIIPQGELVTENGYITYVGPARERTRDERDEFYRIIEGKNKLIMPGFVNAHTHAAMVLFRGYADDMTLQDWLEKKIWPVEDKLQSKDIYWGTMLAVCEMIKGGTTCFADMYFHMEEAAAACLESGIRASLSQGLVGFSTEKAAETLEKGMNLIRNWHGAGEGRITTMLGPHAPYTCPPDFLQKVADTAASLQIPMHIHLAETRFEVEESIKTYGMRPIELMEKIGLLEQKVLAAHCVHLTRGEIETLAARKTAIAHNPGSNLKLGSGLAPLAELLSSGALVSLGTDGAASNNNLDMMEEMRLASLLSKGVKEDPTLIPALEAIKLATINGSKALFLEEGCGTLQDGARADLIMIDLNAAHLQPLHSIPAHLVYSAISSDVEMVMVNGKVLMENRRLLTVDEEKVIYEAGKIAARLVGAV